MFVGHIAQEVMHKIDVEGITQLQFIYQHVGGQVE